MAPPRRLPRPANDNPHPAGRPRLIVLAAAAILALAALALGSALNP